MTSFPLLYDDGSRSARPASDTYSIEPEVAEICEWARYGDLARARDLIQVARWEAPTPVAFVEHVLAPTMRRVGNLWESGEIDRARAGALATIADRALDDLVRADAGPRDRGRIGVACPTGEWHDLPAKMVSTIVGREGFDVSHLGASVSTVELERFVTDARPVAVAISCSLSASLVHAAEAIDAVHHLGVPVIVGGAAFGDSDRRARTLGADGWSTDAASLLQTLETWERRAPDLSAHPLSHVGAALTDQSRARIVDSALRALARSMARDSDAQLSTRTALRLSWLLSTAEAAALTGDETVMTDAFAWWQRRQPRQNPQAAFLGHAVAAMASAIEPGRLRSILLRAAENS